MKANISQAKVTVNASAASKRISHNYKEQVTAFLFLIPAIVVFAVFKYYPILQGFFVSFFEINIVKLPGKFVGFNNYIKVFRDDLFYAALFHNLKFWAVGLIMNFWPPILLALFINEVRKLRTLVRMLYFIPAIAPGIAVTVLWKYIWQPDYGFANYLLGLFHISAQMWLNDIRFTYWCMYFPGLLIAGGMNMLIYLAAMQDVPEEHYEAAVLEGAGFLARVRYITLPQIIHIVKIMFILDMMGRFNEVTTPLVMTGGGPMGSTETIILYAYKAALNNSDYSHAITLANIAFIIIFFITAIQMKVSSNER